MGVDFVTMVQLIRMRPEFASRERLLMLGRSRMIIKDAYRDRADIWLGNLEPGLTVESLMSDGQYAEPFFKKLGPGTVESLDYSGFEGATHAHDLNKPLPKKLKGKFDVVYDGGTLEHVFDVRRAFSNAFELLVPGGVFIASSPGNNFFGHAFYQFGPEVVYSFWKRACGCEVLSCLALPEIPRFKTYPLPDPAETGRRLKMRGKQHPVRTHLFYAVRKPLGDTEGTGDVMQSDYERKWSKAG